MTTVGLFEWKDAFNIENIPSTIIEKKPYHIEMGTFTGNRNNQIHLEMSCIISITFLLNGFANPADAIDRAVLQGESIINECVKPSNSLVQTSIKDVVFRSFTMEPIAASNDNIVKGKIEFSVLVIKGF